MIKYSVTFSTNHKGVEKSEEDVKNLTTRLLTRAGIDGATLTRNLVGIWRGQTEDSYTLYILSDNDITNEVEALALNLKVELKQFSIMIEKTFTDTKFL